MQKGINFSNLAENSAVFAKPLIKDGVVYIGACETHFYAIDIKSGRKLWSYKTDGIITGSAIMHNDIIYVGSFDTYLYAFSREGNILWRFKADGMIATSPTIHNDLLYFGSCDNNVYAVSLKTRELLWKFRAGDEVIGDILIEDGRIYFGSQDNYMYCLDLNGNIVWKFKTGGSIALGLPQVSGDILFFASADQNLYAVKKVDGSFVWGFRTGDMTFNHPLVFGNLVCVGSRDKYFYALDKDTGTIAWKFYSTDRITCAPVLYKEAIVFGTNKIYVLDKNGHLVWSYPISTYYCSDGLAIAAEGILVFGSEDGYIFALNADNGKLIWKFKTNSGTIINPKGVLPPPKHDTSLFDKMDGAKKEVKKTIKEPYTFTTLLDAFGVDRQDRKEYGVTEGFEQNQYKAANEPGLYGGDNPRDKKKQEEMIKITRTLLGN